MRRKYYVSSGGLRRLVLASNVVQACIIALRSLPDGENLITGTFRVSERGFDEHDDDVCLTTEAVINIMLAAQAEEE